MRQKNTQGQVLNYHEGAACAKALQTPDSKLLNDLAFKYVVSRERLWGRIVNYALYQVAELQCLKLFHKNEKSYFKKSTDLLTYLCKNFSI